MKNIYDSRQWLKYLFIFTAILIAIASHVISDMLIKELAQEERHKMEVWAEATRLTASKDAEVIDAAQLAAQFEQEMMNILDTSPVRIPQNNTAQTIIQQPSSYIIDGMLIF